MISEEALVPQQYIDFKDKDNNWLVGLILSRTKHQIKIRLEGYSSNSDQIINISSLQSYIRNNKILPFRTLLRGLTGFKRKPSTRQHWKFSKQNHAIRLSKLNEFIINPKKLNSSQMVQYIRGEHYFYIDFLMNLIFRERDEIVKVYQYFERHLILCKHYLSKIIQVGLKQWLESENKFQSEEQKWKQTYHESYFEIFDGLYIIGAYDERNIHTIKLNEKIIREVFSAENHHIYMEIKIRQADIITKYIKFLNKCYQYSLSVNHNKIPHPFLICITKLFLFFKNRMKKQLQLNFEQYYQKMLQVIKKNLDLLQNVSKHPQIDRQYQDLFTCLKLLCQGHRDSIGINKWIDECQLNHCIMMIKSDKLQRKLKGLNKYKDYGLRLVKDLSNNVKNGFIEYLYSLKLIQLIIESNNNIQFYKKSLEVIFSFAKYSIVSMKGIIYLWQNSINMHISFVKYLYQYLLEIISYLKKEELEELIAEIERFYQSDNPDKCSHLNIEFYFQLIIHIIKYNNREKTDSLQEYVKRFTFKAYQMLVELRKIDSPQSCYLLIKNYAKIIMISGNNNLVNFLFDNLRIPETFELIIHILVQMYMTSYEYGRKIYVPKAFFKYLSYEIQSKQLSPEQTHMIIKLINQLIGISKTCDNSYEIPKEQFKQLWLIFKNKPEHIKNVFYQWIIFFKKYEHYSQYATFINPIFTASFRQFILQQIIKNESFIDYSYLSKKQIEIIIQLIITNNTLNDKLQKKNYQSTIKSVYRLKQVQLNYQSIVWDIFGKCRNHEVLILLNQFIINIYMSFVEKMPINLRKGRIDDLMSKLAATINEYKQGNILIVQHSLSLLKGIVQLAKQQKKKQINEKIHNTRIKIQISIQNKIIPFDVNYQDTIKNIKYNISQYLKLKPAQFKLVNSKNQQFGFDTRDLPIYALTDKYFKIIQIPEEEQTLTKFIFSFFDQKLQLTLIQMMQNQLLCSQAQNLLDELPLKSQKRVILDKIHNILQKFDSEDNSNSVKYYHLFQIKILLKNLNDQIFIKGYIQSLSFQKLLKHLNHPLNSKIQIVLINKIFTLLIRLLKNNYTFPARYNIQGDCLILLIKISEYSFIQHQNTSWKQNYMKIFEYCFNICQDLLKPNNILHFYISHPLFQQFMQNIYLNLHHEKLRQISTQKFIKYLELTDLQSEQTILLSMKLIADCQIIYRKINDLFKQSNCHITKSILQFYNLYGKIIRKINKGRVSQILIKNRENCPSMWEFILSNLFIFKLHKNIININKHNIFLFTGNLYLLKAFIMVDYSLMTPEIINFIMEDCLGFKINYPYQPLCKYFLAKKTAFQIIDEIFKNNNDLTVLHNIMNIVAPNHKIKLWRTLNNWSVLIKPQSKQAFRGLNNPGCMCYMNSILQQLYMVDQFKTSIQNLKINEKLEIKHSEGSQDQYEQSQQLLIIKQLKDLFFNLTYSQQNSINPISFAKTFRTLDNKPLIKINQQMDIDQFASLFFEKLEKGLKSMDSPNFIKELFSGVYSRQVISKECDHQSQKEEQFFSMSLEVKNNILQSFKSLVKIDILDGQNKYYCQKCDKKVKAQMLQSIKKLPPYLILCLKRFQYNYEAELKIKINDYCQFYPEINLKQFSKQEVNKKVVTNDVINDSAIQYEDDYFIYKLKGVVVHLGQADSGHYYSFIEVRKNEWYEFNDQEVIPFDVKKLSSEAFGNRQTYNEQKIRNAYLLIYERQQKKHDKHIRPQQLQEIDENKIIVQTIKKSNRQKYKFELIFSNKYEQFQQRLTINYEHLRQIYRDKFISQSQQESSRQLQILQKKWTEYHLSYYFLIKIRKENVESFIESSKFIQEYIKKSHLMVQMLLQIFISPSFIEEFFIFNPSKEKIKVLTKIFYLTITQKFQNIHSTQHPIQETTEIKESTNPYQFKSNFKFITKIFKVLKIILNAYKFQTQLTNLIIKLLQFLDASNERGTLYHILYQLDLEKIYFILITQHLAPTNNQNERKNMMMLKNMRKQCPLLYFPQIETNIKYEPQNCLYENWRLLYLTLKLKQKIQKTLSSESYQYNYQKLITKYTNFIDGLPSNKVSSLIYENNTIKGAYYFLNMFKSTNKMNVLLDYIEKGLKDLQSTKYRSFMLLILAILSDNSFNYQYIDRILNIFENALRHNSSYFIQTDIISQWIHILSVYNPQFALKLSVKKQIFDLILPWLNKITTNIPDTIKKNKSNYERTLNRYYGIVVSTEAKDYQNKFALMKKDFELLKSGKFTTKPKVDICIKQFAMGDKIQYCQSNSYNWKKGKVLQNNYGNLLILKNERSNDKILISQDSQRISYLQREQSQLDEIYDQSQQSDISCSQPSSQKDEQSN